MKEKSGQNRRGHHYESWILLSFTLTLVLNFSPLSHSEHYTGNTLCQHHFGTSWKKITKKSHQHVRPHPDLPWKHYPPLDNSVISSREDDINSNCGAEPQRKSVFANASSIVLMGRRSLPDWWPHATLLKYPATMSTWSCTIAVRTARKNFFPMPRFWTNWLLMCNDTIVKKDSPLRGSLRHEAREITACKAPPHCRSLANWCSPLPVSEVELTLMLWWKVSFVNFIA